jgi:hypothetical protein
MTKDLPPPELLRKLLDYNPDTGLLTWNPRPLEMFKSERIGKGWNSRYANSPALNSRCKKGYCFGSIFKKLQRAHRVSWAIHYGEWPGQVIDHIDGDPANNRIENLRDVSRSQNQRNMKMRKDNTSGVVGVCWDKRARKWQASITLDGRTKGIGNFKSKADAIAARKAAEIDHCFHENHGRKSQ